jgi:hypothetical protein
LETAGRLLGEPGLGLFGYVSGMIVENELDGCVSWIGGIDKLIKKTTPGDPEFKSRVSHLDLRNSLCVSLPACGLHSKQFGDRA